MKRLQLLPIGESMLTQTGSTLLSTLLSKQMNVKMSCGGRGYCATCRVTVKQGMNQLSPPESREKKTLSVLAQSSDSCRLACQARVIGDGVVVELPKGMYIEKAEDLSLLLGTRAPENILHPIDGRVLIPKDKIITRSLLEQSRSLEKEVERIKRLANGDEASESSSSMSSVQRVGRFMATGSGLAPTRMGDSFTTSTTFHFGQRPRFASADPYAVNLQGDGSVYQPPKEAKQNVLEAGAIFDKFQLIEEIGRGGSGIVYKALHTKLKSVVAMKFLNPSTLSESRSVVERFRNEARLLAQLSHPNVVRVLDFEDSANIPYVVMEYVDGISASQLIKINKRLALARTLPILSQIAHGLNAAHKLGIVHRDVKPGNILVAKDNTAKLVDLGLATKLKRSDGSENQHLAAVEGTVGYMAPEQMTDGVLADHRADIYSLGVTFYHMITGMLPFHGLNREEVMQKHRSATPLPPQHYVRSLPDRVGTVVLKMMEKDPANRPQSYDEVLQLLGSIDAIQPGITGEPQRVS